MYRTRRLSAAQSKPKTERGECVSRMPESRSPTVRKKTVMRLLCEPIHPTRAPSGEILYPQFVSRLPKNFQSGNSDGGSPGVDAARGTGAREWSTVSVAVEQPARSTRTSVRIRVVRDAIVVPSARRPCAMEARALLVELVQRELEAWHKRLQEVSDF